MGWAKREDGGGGGGGRGGAFLNFDGRQFHAALHNFSGQTRLCSRKEGLSLQAGQAGYE